MGTTGIQHGNGLIIEVEAAENECVGLYDSIASNESEEKAEPTRKQKPHEKEGASSYRKHSLVKLMGLPGCG